MRRSTCVLLLVALFVLVIAGGASAFVVSHARSDVVQPQPPPGTCHARGAYPFTMPDLHCTPGALNPAVTEATIGKTICRRGYTSTIRPSTSITGPEKRASIRAYGFRQGTSSYEYDHLISLELGGAANDSRNLWPETGSSPNLKDKVENYLHARVCDGHVSLTRAQRIIALDWVSFYNQNVKPKPKPKPPPPPPPVTVGLSRRRRRSSRRVLLARGRDRPHDGWNADGVRPRVRRPRPLAQRLNRVAGGAVSPRRGRVMVSSASRLSTVARLGRSVAPGCPLTGSWARHDRELSTI